MKPLRVKVRQILAIRRNRCVEHGRILSVCGELSLIEVRQRFGATRKKPCKQGGADECQRYQERRRYTASMSANELAGAIRDCVWSRTDGLVSQVSLQVVSKGPYRGVALLWILLQRFCDNRVEVAAQHPGQLVG